MPVSNVVRGQKVAPDKPPAARALRQQMTAAEKALWARLRSNRLDGWHFRRQQVIAGFIVDFYCHAAALIIEVDGEIHQSQGEYDRERDEVLQSLGFRILRFTNQVVMEEIQSVLEEIRKNLTPFPEREGGTD